MSQSQTVHQYHFLGKALVRQEIGKAKSIYFASPEACYNDSVVYLGIHSAHVKIFRVVDEYITALGLQDGEKPITWAAVSIHKDIESAKREAKQLLQPYLDIALTGSTSV